MNKKGRHLNTNKVIKKSYFVEGKKKQGYEHAFLRFPV